MSIRENVVIKVRRLKDFVEHTSRADRVFYYSRGTYYVAIAGSMIWAGDIGVEPEDVRKEFLKVLNVKGVEVEDILKPYEVPDYLKSLME
ncbi:hypothetical protein [Thermofilum pendens]|uniref:Uncharacterized protein n=1 Tax=Thermofilum pendens (strain DSM 2475 / Hrk 5) TaxID=368408 RepID=A1S1C8_THEPD|nr:hypothetical protein [Thermofilum pendens]ABL79258.1 hypothetical protein Tpen_1863 [Thermofilum pendens Hrk 5]